MKRLTEYAFVTSHTTMDTKLEIPVALDCPVRDLCESIVRYIEDMEANLSFGGIHIKLGMPVFDSTNGVITVPTVFFFNTVTMLAADDWAVRRWSHKYLDNKCMSILATVAKGLESVDEIATAMFSVDCSRLSLTVPDDGINARDGAYLISFNPSVDMSQGIDESSCVSDAFDSSQFKWGELPSLVRTGVFLSINTADIEGTGLRDFIVSFNSTMEELNKYGQGMDCVAFDGNIFSFNLLGLSFILDNNSQSKDNAVEFISGSTSKFRAVIDGAIQDNELPCVVNASCMIECPVVPPEVWRG